MSPSRPQPRKLAVDAELLKSFAERELSPAVEKKLVDYLEQRPKLLEQATALSGDGFLKRLREVRQRSLPPLEAVREKPILRKPEEDAGKFLTESRAKLNVPEELANYPLYEVVKELGRGGMGVVYLATNIQLERLEVIKVLNERLLEHEGAKERFLREVRAVSSLSHPNIVTSYSLLPLGKLLVFVMEYVPGIDLQKYIERRQPIPVSLACDFASQIAAGLRHAHQKGLVHRDIKPANVIVDESSAVTRLKVLDFGLAKATSEKSRCGLTQDGTLLGTPEYMSPEQTLNAATADIRADIYSLGCTLYCMLIGQPPFCGTHGEVMLAHAQREADLVNLSRPDVPLELAAIIATMMAKRAAKRYQTPTEVIQALSPFLVESARAGKQSAIQQATIGTVQDGVASDRETSVETPLQSLLLKATDHQLNTPSQFKTIAERARGQRRATKSQRARRTARKPLRSVGYQLCGLSLAAAMLFWSLWVTGRLKVRTPTEDVVVEPLQMVEQGRISTVEGYAQHYDDKVFGTLELHTEDHSAAGFALSNQTPSSKREATIVLGTPWEIENDCLTHGNGDGEQWILFGDRAWTDYEFTFEFMHSMKSDGLDVLFRSPSDDRIVHWGTGWLGDKAILEYRDAKSNFNPVHANPKPFPAVDANQWHNTRTIVKDNFLECYLNGMLVWKETGIPYDHGRVGIRVWNRNDNKTSKVRNLIVKDLDGNLLWEGLPSLTSSVK